MLVVKVWCLPVQTEEQLQELHQSIVKALKDTQELKVKDEKDIMVLFPSDMMKYGLGQDILIEISGSHLFLASNIDFLGVRLTKGVGVVVQRHFPDAKIQCDLHNMRAESSWFSGKTQ